MKDKFLYLTILVFLLTLGITGFLYYRMTLKTVIDYDNIFVDDRNEVISQIDTLSNTLNTAENAETVDAQIQSLITKKTNFENKFNSESQPDINPNEIVKVNKDFLDKTQEIIETAEEYRNSFSNDEIDQAEKMEEYNTKVTEINSIIDHIKEVLDENNKGLFNQFI